MINRTYIVIKLIIVLSLAFFPSIAQSEADVTLGAGNTTGIPGSSDNLVEVSLTNPDHKVSAIETLLVDEDNSFICTGCTPDPVRASGFICFTYEQDNGGCKVIMVDVDASELIEIGNGAVFTVDYVVSTVDYTMVSGSRPSDRCISITPIDSIIADDLEDSLSVREESGEVCFITCGDVYPDESSPGANDCGDGVVNIFDVLEAIDIALGIGVHSDCQLTRADLPNGIPPDCRAPDGVINIFDILVIIDLTLDREDCCRYYYTHVIKCATDEDCDDGNVCTDDICDPATGCKNIWICECKDDSDCIDENVCNGSETCVNGSCVEGTPLVCDDQEECTKDSCDPATGCKNTWICECQDDSDCIDENVCNGSETCVDGSCVVSTPLVCDDQDVCNGTETCDPADGCQPGTPLVCDDQDVCNGTETCDPANGCQPGTPLVCDDQDVCNGTETCEPADGCQPGTPLVCDDGLWCNGLETCEHADGCQPGVDPCPDQICNENTDSCEPSCQLTINPPSATLCPGNTIQFTAIETGTCNTPDYEWTDNLEHGDVDPNGLFTAVEEGSVPETGEVCVVDHANGDISACASVTIIECGSGECSVIICEGEVPGRRNIPLGCYGTIQLNASAACCVNPPCFEWYIDPPSAIGSTITTNPDGTALFTAGCDCSNLVEETIVVVDPCNGSISDSITVSTGSSVMLDVLDAVTHQGDTGFPVNVSLENLNSEVGGIQVDLYDEGDYLTCTGCEPDRDRALSFTCSAAEQTNGDCTLVLLSISDDLIAKGDGTILTVTYDIKEDTLADVCFGIDPQNANISDVFGDPLSVCTESGDLCPFICGDVYPRECCGDTSCGDGVVDIFDIMEEMDFATGIVTPSDCQAARADVPTGTPPYCADPDDEINIFDGLVIVDMGLGKANCCDYYYLGEIY